MTQLCVSGWQSNSGYYHAFGYIIKFISRSVTLLSLAVRAGDRATQEQPTLGDPHIIRDFFENDWQLKRTQE